LCAVLGTHIGSAIFQKEAIEARYTQFLEARDRLIDELIGNDFLEDEIDSFKKIMLNETLFLKKSGLNIYENKDSSFNFLAGTVVCPITSMHDDWEWGLLGVGKTMDVSQNKCARMPWEEVCFGKGPLPGISETIKVPASLLAQNVLARNAVLKLFSGIDLTTLTFAHMKSEISRHQHDLRALDPSFIQEITFLMEVAEPLAERNVQQNMLDVFPVAAALGDESPAGKPQTILNLLKDSTPKSADTPRTMPQALEAVQKIRHSHQVQACRNGVLKEVEGVISFLSALNEGQPPAFSGTSSMSAFFKNMVNRAEMFLVTSIKDPNDDSKTITLHGKDALTVILRDFVLHEGVDTAALGRTLQAFKWLLTDEQNHRVDSRMKEIITQKRSILHSLKALPPADASSTPSSSSSVVAIVSTSAALSSSSSCGNAVAATPKEAAKSQANKEARMRLKAVLAGKACS